MRTDHKVKPLEEVEFDTEEYWNRLKILHFRKKRQRMKTMARFKIY